MNVERLRQLSRGNEERTIEMENEVVILEVNLDGNEFLRRAEEALKEVYEEDDEKDWEEYLMSDGRIKMEIDTLNLTLEGVEFEEGWDEGVQ